MSEGRDVARAVDALKRGWPVSIGGKTDCDQIDVGCDYFAGDIDYIAVDADSDW